MRLEHRQSRAGASGQLHTEVTLNPQPEPFQDSPGILIQAATGALPFPSLKALSKPGIRGNIECALEQGRKLKIPVELTWIN